MKSNSWSYLANLKPNKAGYKRNQFSKMQLLVFILAFGLIGIILIKSFAAPNPNLPGDLNNDNSVNITDLSILLSNYGSTTTTALSTADINSDGTVNILDLSILLSHYGQTLTATKPAIPTGLVATAGDTKVTLNWTANPTTDQVNNYQVYWTTDSSFASGVSQFLSIAGTSYTVTGLTNGTTYYFKVSAHNSAGYGDYSSTSASATPVGVGGGGTSSGNGIGLLELGDNLKNATSPGRYGMVIVSIDDAPAACALPAPTRSLVYRSGLDISQSINYGIDYNTASANGWLLKDSSGSYLYNSTFQTYVGDVGNSSYQQTWISNVIAMANANHCKGIFIDNILRDIKTLVGFYPAKYPDVTSWDNAMVSFVNAVGPALKAQGIYVAYNAVGYTGGDGNSNDGTLDVQWWQQVGPSSSALMNENWMQTSEGSLTTRLSGSSSWMQFWDGWQRLVATAQNINRDFIGLSYGANTNTAIMHYGRGSFLLDWNGGGSVFMFSPTNGGDPWNLAWTSDIGTPTGTKSQVATGVWTRTYTKGVVYVNTTGSTVSAGGHSIGSGDAYIGP